MDQKQAEVLKAEQARVDALLARDPAALANTLADDLVYVHSSGTVDTKASFVDKIATGHHIFTTYTLHNIGVRVYGDCAVLAGEANFNTGKPFHMRYTTMWVKSAGAWRCVHYQSTKLPEAAAH